MSILESARELKRLFMEELNSGCSPECALDNATSRLRENDYSNEYWKDQLEKKIAELDAAIKELDRVCSENFR